MRTRMLFCLTVLAVGLYGGAGAAGSDPCAEASASTNAQSAAAREAREECARHLLSHDQPQAALDILRTLPHKPSDDLDLAFTYGLAALQAADALPSGREKRALLDEAIRSFRGILVAAPDRTRTRLELARAFFEKRDDHLAERHFRRVLADDLPVGLAAEVREFLSIIHERRRWRGGLSLVIAPDTNINHATSADVITVLGQPYRLSEDERATSGVGVYISGNVEYRLPLDRAADKWRFGIGISRRDYAARRFDDTLFSAHSGPDLALTPDINVSFLASAKRRWLGHTLYSTALGGRTEFNWHINRRWQVNLNASWHDNLHRTAKILDGPSLDANLSLLYAPTSTIRLHANADWDKEIPREGSLRSNARWAGVGVDFLLPHGITVGGAAQVGWTRHERRGSLSADPGNRYDRQSHFVLSGHHRAFTILGFSPRVAVILDRQESNAPLANYRRIRGELGLVRHF